MLMDVYSTKHQSILLPGSAFKTKMFLKLSAGYLSIFFSFKRDVHLIFVHIPSNDALFKRTTIRVMDKILLLRDESKTNKFRLISTTECGFFVLFWTTEPPTL